MATEDRYTIEKLKADNFPTWKFQMKHLLMAKGLFQIVDKTENAPADTATADDKAKYTARTQRAFSTLALAVSSELVYLITDCDSADKAWSKLHSHFERDTVANRLFLKKQYFRMVMKGGATITQHIKGMKELTDKLAAVKAPIAEEDQIVTLLGSLPSSFDNVVTALESRLDDLTLEFVHQSLLNEEQKRTESVVQPTDAALASSKPKQRKKLRCYVCQSPDHLKRDCPKNHSQHQRQKTGHTAQHVSGDSAEHHHEELFTASAVADCFTTGQGQPWIIDSGASRHMTMDKKLFSGYQEFSTPEKVSIGNGELLDAVGVGTVVVELVSGHNSKVKRRQAMCDVLHVPDLAVNLFSVRAVTARGYVVQFGSRRCWIKGKDRRVRAGGTSVLSGQKSCH